MFKNASTSCRYYFDESRLVKMKIEELSQEPIVQLIHDFLTTDEVNEVLKQSSTRDFAPAPVAAAMNTEDAYASGRFAKSYFIDEDEDNIADLTKKIKAR